MSRHHYVHAHEASTIDYDIKHRSAIELQELYGIEFFEDPDSKLGRVYDPVLHKEFGSLSEWAATQVQDEEWSELAHAHQNSRIFDDEH